MPWTPKEFKERHNHSLSGSEAAQASKQANAILEKTGDEGLAIATANKHAKERRYGGPSQSGHAYGAREAAE